MTASAIKDLKVSEFALALLEGTGWYQVDYTKADPLVWGKGKGCDFLNTPCYNKNSLTSAFEEFCPRLQGSGCSFTGRGYGYCGSTNTVYTSSSLSSSEDYWGNKTIVNDDYADNCPYYQIYSNRDCQDIAVQSTSTLKEKEYYGEGSMCFDGTLSPNVNTYMTRSIGYCFQSRVYFYIVILLILIV